MVDKRLNLCYNISNEMGEAVFLFIKNKNMEFGTPKMSASEEANENLMENDEVVKKVYKQLSQKLKNGDKIYNFKDGEIDVIMAYTNPAGSISIHDFSNGHDYVIWQDGQIETLDDSKPHDFTDNPSAEYLYSLIKRACKLEIEEIEQPK